MKKTIIFIIILIIVIIGLSNQNSEEGTIKIGVLSPVGGAYASIGEFALNGHTLAVDEINNNGGVRGKDIELVVETHRGEDNSGAVSAYLSLKNRGVDLILGPVQTNTGLAVAPVACGDDTLVVSPAIGGSDFTKACGNTFSTWPVDRKNSKTLGSRVVEEGYKNIAVIGSVQAWEKEQADAVVEGINNAGGNIVHVEITNNKLESYVTEVTKIISSNPDAVVFTNYGYMHVVAKKLRELGSEAQFYSVLLTENHLEKSDGAFEDTIVISAYSPEGWFKETYEVRYDHSVSFPSDSSYDAVMILAEAIEETKSTNPDTLAEYILEIEDYEGASGVLSVEATGNVAKTPVYQVVQDGVLVSVE